MKEDLQGHITIQWAYSRCKVGQEVHAKLVKEVQDRASVDLLEIFKVSKGAKYALFHTLMCVT